MMNPSAPDPLESMRREWSLLVSGLPSDPSSLERLISSLPANQQETLRRQASEIFRSKEVIEQRMSALEAYRAASPQGEDERFRIWQDLLLKVSYFGWVDEIDFQRLEGRMPVRWPAAAPDPGAAGSLAFAEWCRRSWKAEGRVSSVLAFAPTPELAVLLSDSFRAIIAMDSDRDLEMIRFLHAYRTRTATSALLFAAVGATGHEEALKLIPGEFQAMIIGSSAWRKWASLPPSMLQWMLSELTGKICFLAIDADSPPDAGIMESAGWIADERAPGKGPWSVWKVRKIAGLNEHAPFHDVRTHSLSLPGIGSVERTAIQSERMVVVRHFVRFAQVEVKHSHGRLISPPTLNNSYSLAAERKAWGSLQGLHPMIPDLVESSPSDTHLKLGIPQGKAQWMPSAGIVSDGKETAGSLQKLFRLLLERDLLPPGLGAGDFIWTPGGCFLTRIGFSDQTQQEKPISCTEPGDPMNSFLTTLAGWHHPPPLPADPLGGCLHPEVSSFHPAFREMAAQAMASMSMGDFLEESPPRR
jgi:hypothetical protein